MLTLQVINADPEGVIAKLAKKHFDAKEPINRVIELDKHRRDEDHEYQLLTVQHEGGHSHEEASNALRPGKLLVQLQPQPQEHSSSSSSKSKSSSTERANFLKSSWKEEPGYSSSSWFSVFFTYSS